VLAKVKVKVIKREEPSIVIVHIKLPTVTSTLLLPPPFLNPSSRVSSAANKPTMNISLLLRCRVPQPVMVKEDTLHPSANINLRVVASNQMSCTAGSMSSKPKCSRRSLVIAEDSPQMIPTVV